MLEAAQCRCPQFDAIQIVVDVVKHLGLGWNNDTFSLLCHHVATRFHSRNCCFHAVQESVSRSSFSERRRFSLFTFLPCLKAFFAAFFAAFTAAFITAFFSFLAFLAFLLFLGISRLHRVRCLSNKRAVGRSFRSNLSLHAFGLSFCLLEGWMLPPFRTF